MYYLDSTVMQLVVTSHCSWALQLELKIQSIYPLWASEEQESKQHDLPWFREEFSQGCQPERKEVEIKSKFLTFQAFVCPSVNRPLKSSWRSPYIELKQIGPHSPKNDISTKLRLKCVFCSKYSPIIYQNTIKAYFCCNHKLSYYKSNI